MKFVKIAGVTSIVVIALIVLGVTLAFAQKPSPTDIPGWNPMRDMIQGSGATGNGGMMGSRSMMGGSRRSMLEMHNQITRNDSMGAIHEWMHQSSDIHNAVWNSLVMQLGMTSDELTAQINNGSCAFRSSRTAKRSMPHSGRGNRLVEIL